MGPSFAGARYRCRGGWTAHHISEESFSDGTKGFRGTASSPDPGEALNDLDIHWDDMGRAQDPAFDLMEQLRPGKGQ